MPVPTYPVKDDTPESGEHRAPHEIVRDIIGIVKTYQTSPPPLTTLSSVVHYQGYTTHYKE